VTDPVVTPVVAPVVAPAVDTASVVAPVVAPKPPVVSDPATVIVEPVKPIMVPKARLDAKSRQMDAMRVRLNELEAAQRAPVAAVVPAVPIEKQLEDIYTQVAAARKDNKPDEEAALQTKAAVLLARHIDGLKIPEPQDAKVLAKQVQDGIRLDSVIDTIEARNTKLNPDHADFDEGLSSEIMDMYDTFLRSEKYSAPDALVRAYEIVTGQGMNAAAVVPRTTNVDANLSAALGQGPDLGNAGLASDKAGLGVGALPSKLTDDEIAALPDDTRRRLRGDFL
jgi:hypothetical protein